MSKPPSIRGRFVAAILIGLITGIACYVMQISEGGGLSDFRQAIWLVRDLLQGKDPYDYKFHAMFVPYPLPAALFALPFYPFSQPIGTSLFVGLTSVLLAFGLTREGYERLALFLCGPYWIAVFLVQWSPLIAASAFFSWLAPVVLVKPQIALPVLVTHLNRRRIIAIVVVGLVSLAVMPTWPFRWLGGIVEYQKLFPLFTWPGMFLLLALLCYRDRDVWMLLIGAILPQRAMYDLTWLWLIPRSLRGLLITSAVSWLFTIAPYLIVKQPAEILAVGAYVPMLVVILLRNRQDITVDRMRRIFNTRLWSRQVSQPIPGDE